METMARSESIRGRDDEREQAEEVKKERRARRGSVSELGREGGWEGGRRERIEVVRVPASSAEAKAVACKASMRATSTGEN